MKAPTSNDPADIGLHPTQTPLATEERTAMMTNPGFGRVFTDHMISLRWTAELGWHDGQLLPRAPLKLDPATLVFHYGQSIFEGLKAYRQARGSVAVFRPHENARRFQRAARRMAMPELSEGTFAKAVELLVRQDRAWVPAGPEESLYLRPMMLATGVGLEIRPSDEFLFLLIASPVGAYFPRGVTPISVWLSEDFARAAPGGTGAVKCGGNYAASLMVQAQATKRGCDQVVWLDAVEHRWIEEMGGMNLFFVFGTGDEAKLVTPPLTGSILPGVTRDSLLTLARDLGYLTGERPVSVEEWRTRTARGSITEAFACGTAATITPIGYVKSDRGSWTVGNGDPGPVTMRLRDALLGIQRGVAVDTHDWMHEIG